MSTETQPVYVHWAGFATLIGGLLVHGNDIADLPRMALPGVAAVGVVWILLAIGLVALVRRV